MTSLLIGLLLVLIMPLFVATWRTSLLGLASQGLIMGWIAWRQHPEPSLATLLALADLVVLRGLVAPLLLYREQRRKHAPRRNDVIPPNMLSWSVAMGLVLVAFRFADAAVPVDGEGQTFVAVAAAALLLGLLVLASAAVPFSQMVGALRVENAIVMLELGATHGHAPVEIRVAQLALYALTVGLFAFYLRTLTPAAAGEPAQAERPAL